MHEFFDSGQLLLTTFARCRQHDISSRMDSQDGRVTFSIWDDHEVMAGVSITGLRSYMLCASQSNGPHIQSRFGTDSWIEIVDADGFANAVARAINSTHQTLIGECRYVDSKEVNKAASSSIDDRIAPLFRATKEPNADVEAEFHKANARLAELVEGGLGDSTYFMKDRVPYEIEQEVRFVWPVDHNVDSPIVISCPDATQFCRPGP